MWGLKVPHLKIINMLRNITQTSGHVGSSEHGNETSDSLKGGNYS
jgi:hypothetical protein